MEEKKSKRAYLKSHRLTVLIICLVLILSSMLVAMERTSQESRNISNNILSSNSSIDKTEMVPTTLPFNLKTPQPSADVPEVAEKHIIVKNNNDIEESKKDSTEDLDNALSVPSVPCDTSIAPLASKCDDCEEAEDWGIPEKSPEFPGGDKALADWISSHLNYPMPALEPGIKRRVLITFIVNIDGTISEPKILRSVNPALDQEALRITDSMPRWKPGSICGKPVRVKYTLPVIFKLPK